MRTMRHAAACSVVLVLSLTVTPDVSAAAAAQPGAWAEWSPRLRARYYLDGKATVKPMPPAAAYYFAAAQKQRAATMKDMRDEVAREREALARRSEQARLDAEPRLRTQEFKLKHLAARLAVESEKNLRPDFSPLLGKPEIGKVGWLPRTVRVEAVLGPDEMLLTLRDGTPVLARGWPTAGVADGGVTRLNAPAEVTGRERPATPEAAGPVFVLRPFNSDPYARAVSEPQFLAYLKHRGHTPATVLEFIRRHGHKPDGAGVAAVVAHVEQSAPSVDTP